MTWLKTWRSRSARFMLALAAVAAAGTAARAQDAPEVPQVVSPLRVESDHNNVNLVSGRTSIDPPVLSVPGAPNLRFDRVQNAAPYVRGTINAAGGGYSTASFSVHHGGGGSESFRCLDFDCTSVTGTGSTFLQNARTFRQAGTGAVWAFNLQHVDSLGPPRVVLYYASGVSYPNGETISYSYETATLPGDTFGRQFYRPVTVTSNLGYFISIAYHPGELGTQGWNAPASATLYASAAPSVPLGRMTYNLDGTSITQYGAQDQNPRTYACTGCANSLGADIERWAGSLQLPTEGAPALQVTTAAGGNVVGAVTRDGVGWNYSYTNLRLNWSASAYLYDRLTVTGPNGFNQVYDVAQIGLGNEARNVVTGVTDSIGRSTSFLFDEAYRPYRVVYPEGNQVDVAYDVWGNLAWRRTRAKPGSGLPDIIEEAFFPTDTCYGGGPQVLCYRPLWSRDGLNRQTDYAYNTAGQLIEQTDPADANGVRRRTIIEYESTTGISRRSVVRICGVGTTCGTSQEFRTEYQYLGSTRLPTLERRRDLATGEQLDTVYSYDPAGRLLSTDGPLPGTDDATFNRYDPHGRRTWEIGARGANGLRTATRHVYRDSDDKVLYTEAGTVPDQDSTTLSVLTRTDLAYDSRRNPIREAVSASGTTYSVVDRAYNNNGLLGCEARRMNPAAFGEMPGGCAHTTASPTYGPDRITLYGYDQAGQLLQEVRAYGVTTANGFPTMLQQNYATYTYSSNGRRLSVTDANGNRAEMTYDGYDRQRRWIFPSTTTPGAVNAGDYEEYGYDAAGNRTSLRKRDGVTITYQYDALNRMIVKTVPASASGAAGYAVHYGYDLRNLQSFARFGSTAGAGVTNTYDAFGRLTTSNNNMGGFSRTLSYQHDPASRRIRLTFPDGTFFTYDHDPANRLTAVRENGAASGIGQLATFAYNPGGLLSSLTRSNGNLTTYDYDDISRLSQLVHNVGNGTVHDLGLGFAYNPASQIVTRTGSNDAYASNTAYDVSRSYAVNGLNQYASAGPATFAYDANGNLRSDGASSFVYDAENRLVSASGARTAALAYDPLGRLFQTSGGAAGTTQFLYDGDELVAEHDGNGNLLRRYAHGVGNDDPIIWYEGSGTGDRRFLLTDERGSIIATSNFWGDGYVTAVNAYDEWGIPNATNVGRFQYTGQAWIPELGMYHYKARIYSPTLGRFLQTDPIGYDDQVNLYAYVGNDPVNAADSTGEATEAGCGSRLGDSASCSGATFIGVGDNKRQPHGPREYGGGGQGQDSNSSFLETVLGCESAMTCAMSRDDRAVLSGAMSPEQYRENAQARAGGVIVGALVAATVATRGLVASPVSFGLNSAAASHAWRHVVTRGLSVQATRSAILRDSRLVVRQLRHGQTMTRTVRVQGRTVEYRIHRLPDGRINVGSIRPPR